MNKEKADMIIYTTEDGLTKVETDVKSAENKDCRYE